MASSECWKMVGTMICDGEECEGSAIDWLWCCATTMERGALDRKVDLGKVDMDFMATTKVDYWPMPEGQLFVFPLSNSVTWVAQFPFRFSC